MQKRVVSALAAFFSTFAGLRALSDGMIIVETRETKFVFGN